MKTWRYLLCVMTLAAGCSQTEAPTPDVSSATPASQSTAPPIPIVQPTPSAVQPMLSAPPEPTAARAPSTTGDWESVLAHIDPARNAVSGEWTKSTDGLHVNAATGARLVIPVAIAGEYDVRITFTRHSGEHSIAIFFPHGSGQAAFEVDAWGNHLGGIQNIAGQELSNNPTRQTDVALTNGRRYTMTLESRTGQVRALLDGRVIATYRTEGEDLSVPDLWTLPERNRLGIGAWNSETTFHAIEIRTLNGTPLPLAATTAPTVNPARPASPPLAASETPPPATAPVAAVPTNRSAAGKRVLLVIANFDFFYREYNDPRAELERAGIKVTVAAGRKERCTPHSGSGEGADRGIVQPDIAIADARADDYDAILFSGGWGSSAYQFAFEGRYDARPYNGDPRVKAAVNRLIGDFIAQDKYVCALCNAVSVLAWARVDGKSPLEGKRVCAPTRQAAPGIYNGNRAQPSCRWHPDANGAILSPAGTLGRPGTAEDDVLVDGKIVTGEDDISAREMGRRIVQLLSQ